MDIGGAGGAEVVVLEYVTKRDVEGGTKAVKADLEDIKKASKDASDMLKGLFSLDVARAAGELFKDMALAVKELGAVIVGVLKDAVLAAADFEKVMVRISVLSNSSTADMAMYNAEILKMAGAVGIGPQKLAEGLERITSLGKSGAEAMEILRVSAELSAVGMGEVGTIATALTGAINSYGAENLSAAQAADILTATVREGGAEANAYAGTLGRIAPMAAQLGISFADLGANLAAFTRLGVSASEATTGISGFMAALITPTKKGSEALAEVGLSYAKLRQQLQSEGLAQTMIGLMNAFRGNDEALRAVLPNIRALRDELGVAGKGAEEYLQIQDRIRNSQGDAAEAFKASTETIRFQMDSLQAGFEAAAISLGQALTPAALELLKALQGLVPMLEDAAEWASTNAGAIREGMVAAIQALKDVVEGLTVAYHNLRDSAREVSESPFGQWLKNQIDLVRYLIECVDKLSERGRAASDAMAKIAALTFGPLGAVLENARQAGRDAREDREAGSAKSFIDVKAGVEAARSAFQDFLSVVAPGMLTVNDSVTVTADSTKKMGDSFKGAQKELKQWSAILKDQTKMTELMLESREKLDKELRKDERDEDRDQRQQMMQDLREEIGLRMQLGNTNGVLVTISDADKARAQAMHDVTEHLKRNRDAELARASALKVVNELLAKSSGEDKKRLKEMKDQLEGANEGAKKLDEWKQAAGQLGEQFLQLGDQTSGAFSGISTAVGYAAKAFSNFKSEASMAQKVVTAAMGAMAIWNSTKEDLSASHGALSGAEQGAAAGSQFGAVGIVVGAIAGGLLGLFSGSKFREMAHSAGQTLGFEVSAELAKAIKKTMEELHVDVKTASLLNLDKAMIDSGKPVQNFKKQVAELFVGVASGSIPAKQGIEQLGKAFTAASNAAAAGDKAAQKMVAQMIQAARVAGVKVPEITAHVKEALDASIQGLQAFTENFQIITPEDAAASAALFASVFWAKVSEDGIMAAGTAMLPAWDAMQQSLKDAGIDSDVVNALLAPMAGIFDILGDEKLSKIVAGLDGATRAVKGLSDAGYMTAGAFQALETIAVSTYDQLIAGGVDAQVALQAIAPTLAQIISDHERYGTVIDDATQKLIDQAAAAGIAFPTDPLLQVVDLLGEIVVLMGGTLPESIRKSTDAMNALAAASAGVNVPGAGEGGQQSDGGGSQPGYARGGTVNAPESGQSVTVHGMEHIMRPEQFQTYLTAAIAQAARAGVGGGGSSQPLVIQVKIGEQQLAQAMVDMRRRGVQI